jgi:hypothetical protein
MKIKDIPIVFTPDNEPYLGLALLFHFDQAISVAMEHNAITARKTHGQKLSDHQKMACLIIPQALSIALSIRELIRQGYLFGGHVLLRSLAERAAILLYLNLYPAEIEKWNRGWEHHDAPTLAKMFDAIQSKQKNANIVLGSDVTAAMNSLLHAKPDSAPWIMVELGGGKLGFAPSKILNRPDLCDDLCANAIPWLVVILGMMEAYFPSEKAA